MFVPNSQNISKMKTFNDFAFVSPMKNLLFQTFIVIELKRSYMNLKMFLMKYLLNISHEIFLDGNLEIFSVQYLGYIYRMAQNFDRGKY